MRHESAFYKLFPPPEFLTMPHAGLEISDDALRTISYAITPKGTVISHFARVDLPPNLVEGGEVKDEKLFSGILRNFVKENKMSYVRVSLPEEKVYLFEIDIPSTEVKAITQHVEFKLEENVPLSASDAVFYFDILPKSVTGNTLRASVSVAPKIYVEKLLSTLHGMFLMPMAFEVAPKSIAKAVVREDSDETHLIVHVMNKKTGIYIVSGGVVCFSSTIGWGTRPTGANNVPTTLDMSQVLKEIHRVYSYWMTRPDTHSEIKEILVVGRDAVVVEKSFRATENEGLPTIHVPNVWSNAFDVNNYVPPVPKEDSMEYCVAAGLGLRS